MAEATVQAASVLGTIAAGIGPFLAVGIVTALLHLAATVLGGQQAFGQLLGAVSWARLPLVMQTGLRLGYAIQGGHDPSPEGLSGLVATTSLGAPLLAELSLWNLWTLVLLGIAVREVARLSPRKAAAAVLAFVALKVALGEIGVVFARFATGLG
jgi:hypothetical protein